MSKEELLDSLNKLVALGKIDVSLQQAMLMKLYNEIKKNGIK